MVVLQLRQMNVPPGQRVEFVDVPWSEFEAMLLELGDRRSSRIAYSHGTLEIMTPSPEHEVCKELIGDMAKILFDELDIENECFGSTTFKRQTMSSGVEPDNCFYWRSPEAMIGKDRINLNSDPPPDLAIEIDVTSKTRLDAYEALEVLELWRYENSQLRIDMLQDGQYVQASSSLAFPSIPIIKGISQYLCQSRTNSRHKVLRGFRQWVREQIVSNGDRP